MTTRRELLAHAIEALRTVEPGMDHERVSWAQELVREYDNLPPAVAAEPVAEFPLEAWRTRDALWCNALLAASDLKGMSAVLTWLNEHRPEPTPASVSCRKCYYSGPTPGAHEGCDYYAHLWPAKPGYTEQQPALSAELTVALVFSVHLMRATGANNQAAIIRAFLDSVK